MARTTLKDQLIRDLQSHYFAERTRGEIIKVSHIESHHGKPFLEALIIGEIYPDKDVIAGSLKIPLSPHVLNQYILISDEQVERLRNRTTSERIAPYCHGPAN